MLLALLPVALRIGFVVLLIGAIYLCVLSVIFLHEAGHWAAAKACGFPVFEFRVGPFQWLRKSGWHFRWQRDFLLSGWIRVQPTGYDKALRLRQLVFLLGGPVANIFTGTIGTYISHVNPMDYLAELISLWTVGSILIGVINLIPVRSHRRRTDGLRILDLFFERRFSRVRFAAYYMDSKDEIVRLLRARDLAAAETATRNALAFAIDVPDSDPMVKALRRIVQMLSEPVDALQIPTE